MDVVLLEVAVVAILILINGLFSMSELAIVSAREVRLRPLADRGDKSAAAAIELARNPRNFLSTVQIGITLVGILAGAFGGATISQLLAERIAALPVVGPYASTVAFVLVVAVITYFSIVVGELIPKSFALSSPEKLARLVARLMTVVSKVARPGVWLLSAPTTAFLRLCGVHANVEPPVTDAEIIGLLDAGAQAGVFEVEEKDIIESVITLERQPVTSVMTPRTEIEWVDSGSARGELWRAFKRGGYSRLPVAQGNLDELEGYVTAKDVLAAFADGEEIDLASIIRKPLFVPESVSIADLLKQFRDAHSHLAVVVDEFGGVEGLVTINDVSEAILGELASNKTGPARPFINIESDGTYRVDGRLPIADLAAELGIPGEHFDGAAFDTVAGLALNELGRIPKAGESFEWLGYTTTITAMERNRIKALTLRRR